jgi:membrane protein DedA with SNARE-associated domain
MTDLLLNLIEEWGIGGIFLALLIEGSAIPFIGTFYIVKVGFILKLTWFEILAISVIGSFLYAVGSYIPYAIGYKLGKSLEYKLSATQRGKIAKVKKSINRRGVWSIAILSPLHLGNVIPFLAGMSTIKLPLYTGLTMLGMAPSTFIFLSIGHIYEGDIKTIVNMITKYQTMFLYGIGVLLLLFLGWKNYKYRTHKKKVEHMR